MILDVDLGNSRLKWRLAGHSDERSSGSLDASAESLVRLAGQIPRVSRIRLASVASELRTTAVVSGLALAFGVDVEVVKVIGDLKGFRTAYAEPELLGVDRWLAALAAYHIFKETCIVVDAGTALTVEFVRNDGLHCGGYIVPGLSVMARSLGEETDAVRISLCPVAGHSGPGINTQGAVNYGLLEMVIGLVERSRAWLSREMACPSPRLILTGGDALHLLPHFPDADMLPDLVLDGLAYASP